MGAMALALWVMVLYSALVEGYLTGMSADVLDFGIGDIQIHAEGYRDAPSLYDTIEDADEVIARLEGQDYRVAPRLIGGGLMASGEQSGGAGFIGIDVEREASTLRIPERLVEGDWVDPADPKGVVIDKRMARILAVGIGDELVVLSQAADGSMANDLFTVRGILFGAGQGQVFMAEAAFRDLMALPEGFHQLIVRIPDGAVLDVAAEQVRGDGLDVMTWRQLVPTVATMLDSTRGMIFVVFFIIYLAVGLLVLNAMLMAVFERIREFGVMKAIGVSPLMVLSLIVLETVYQTLLSFGVALLLCIPTGWYLSTHGLVVAGLSGVQMMGMTMPPVWKAVFTPVSVAGPVVVLTAMVAISVVYPALKAAWIAPLDAMRYQ